MSNITLTGAQRSTILELQGVASLFSVTQNALNSGKKVNNITDNPVSYFNALGLSDRSADILSHKSNTDQGVQALTAALNATSSVDTLLKSIKGVIDQARGGTLSQRTSATVQFKNLGQQLAQLVKDTSYQGLNLLTSTNANLTLQFSERTAATFKINGFNLTNTAAGGASAIFTGGVIAFSSAGGIVFSNLITSKAGSTATTSFKGFSQLDTIGGSVGGGGTVAASIAGVVFQLADNLLDNAISHVRGQAATLGVNVSILQVRSSFATLYSNTLQGGSDNLTLADLNVEAANSQALQLRQQLGIQDLSIAGQQNASILTLLR